MDYRLAVEYCPVAPLLGDFVIAVYGHSIGFIIEYKMAVKVGVYCSAMIENPARLLFYASRVWHQLWVQTGNMIYAISRYRVEKEWVMVKIV